MKSWLTMISILLGFILCAMIGFTTGERYILNQFPDDVVKKHSHLAKPLKTEIPAEKEKTPHTLKYFDSKEISTIIRAAERNKCSYDDFIILLAIRKAEGGSPGNEFGIQHSKAINTNLDTQAGWAAATVVKNRQRWQDAGQKNNFIEFLGSRYCPTEGDLSESEIELNKNWIPNVKYWYEKLKPD